MSDENILNRYKGQAPNLRIASDGENTCSDCRSVEQDPEADSCSKHPNMYHDWDMPEEINFVYTLRCDDFDE